MFTKMYGLNYKGKPNNLKLYFSSYPGLEIKRIKQLNGIAWYQDPACAHAAPLRKR
jgi:hypothetical protein